MSWRRILVYWVSAAALGGLLYLDWRADRPSVDPEPAGAAPIVEYLASRLDAATLRAEGRRLVFARSDGRWSVVEPPDVEIGSDLLDALLDTLTTIRPVEILADTGTPLSEFGLEPPQAVLGVGADGRPVAEIQFGSKNPTRTAVYARRDGQGPVYLLGLNARYYIELILDDVDRQAESAVADSPGMEGP